MKKLDPQAQKLLDNAKIAGLPPAYLIPVEDARERLRNAFCTKGEVEQVFCVENILIPDVDYQIPIRLYKPSNDKKLPILIFYHGGGWVLNDLDTHDDVCRSICNQVNCIVVSVDYRRSPEYKFPTPINDAYSAFLWVANNAEKIGGDKKKIAVGGDSSGGNFAAVIALLSRDRNGPNICFQWLAYPVVDYYLPGTESYKEMANGYSLNRDFMIWFWNNYLPTDFDLNNPYLFPMKAETCKNLPPAFIMTAFFDPLCSEGELYAEKLRNDNVKVKLKRYDNQMHGFIMQRQNIEKAVEAFSDIVNELRKAFE